MGAWTEIVDFTFTANETSRAFTGLNITKDDFIKVVATFVNGTGSTISINLTANSSVASNYHTQVLNADGTTVGAGRDNNAVINYVIDNRITYALVYGKLSENDRLNFFSNMTDDRSSTVVAKQLRYITSSGATFTSGVTSLTFTSTVTDGIGSGSRIQIYRLDAEKVRDITVTSNSTQVDIPVTGSLDPAIGKDSEYLLVGDWINNGSTVTNQKLFPNDLTTATNYHTQRIVGGGTVLFADRFNDALVMRVGESTRNIFYTHIKLSEIGAYTFQNYVIENYGASNVSLTNHFASSTSEAITSITKLNLISSVTNGIGSGSRFELYKLK